MHLAKRLNEELAQQQAVGRSFGNRAVSPEPEQRSRSYECKSPQCKSKGILLILLKTILAFLCI